jgi:hypothetical protein
MTTTEMIYKKAQSLDATRLQELNDFLDFLLQKKQKPKEELFPASKLEAPDSSTPYTGKPLTIEDMDDVISYEAELYK